MFFQSNFLAYSCKYEFMIMRRKCVYLYLLLRDLNLDHAVVPWLRHRRVDPGADRHADARSHGEVSARQSIFGGAEIHFCLFLWAKNVQN